MISHKKIKGLSLDTIDDWIAPVLRSWRNSPEVFKWCRQNDLITQSSHNKWLTNHVQDDTIKMYLIKDGSTPIGVCGLTDMDLVNQRAEFSLYIAPDYQSQGYGKSALRLLLWHSFNTYPYHTIWGEVFDGNHALSVFGAIGFKKEGLRRDFYYRDGKFIDAHIISIKRDEFKL